MNKTRRNVADKASDTLVRQYVESYRQNRGLVACNPRLVVGMMRELQGWPVRNADGGANIAYYSDSESAEAGIRLAQSA